MPLLIFPGLRHTRLSRGRSAPTAKIKQPSPGRESRTLQPLGLFTILVQLIPESWMRYLDQRFGPLSNRLAMQVSHAVLGDNIANQTSGRYYASSRTEHGNDPRNCAALCGGRYRDDRLSSFGPRSAA